MIFAFLCDGLMDCNQSPGCFLNGGQCRHTSAMQHAKNEVPEEIIIPEAFNKRFVAIASVDAGGNPVFIFFERVLDMEETGR